MARDPNSDRRGGSKPDSGASRRRRRPTLRYERLAGACGHTLVAGVDEVGRGCLFGPVAAAAVILDPQRSIRGLDDSKVLEPKLRERLAERIRERAVAWAVVAVDTAVIDRINIYQASRLAMERAVARLDPPPSYLLVDAMRLALPLAQRALVGGDKRSRSIAAASIVAKVERDSWLAGWDRLYPEYNLASNKGYCTADHLRALAEHGPTPLHRRSFRPVAEAAGWSRGMSLVAGEGQTAEGRA